MVIGGNFCDGNGNASILCSTLGTDSLDLKRVLKDTLAGQPSPLSSNLSSILSLILCQHHSKHPSAPASILIFDSSSSAGESIEHISFMNAIFEAQRQRIKIDVVCFDDDKDENEDQGKSSSVLLRQASSITNGYFLSITPTKQPLLLPILFNLSLGSRMHPSQALLALPQQGGADFRGACFCHGQVIDLGFVCSVCLSGKRECGL